MAQGYVVNASEVRQLMERMDMDRDGNVDGDEFLTTLIDWQQVVRLVTPRGDLSNKANTPGRLCGW